MTLRRFADLVVDSDVAFVDLPAAEGPADIVLRQARLPEEPRHLIETWRAPDGADWISIERVDSGYRLTMPGLECAVDASGRHLTVNPASGTIEPRLVHLLLHQVLPLAVSRTGRLVLHACAVETPAGTVAFLGESGAGKSTLAAACSRRGCALVADDAFVVDLTGDEVIAWPTADRLRLWDHMQLLAADVARAPGAGWKVHASVPLAAGPSPLRRLYLLSTADPPRISIERLAPPALRVSLLSHLFRLDITDTAESRRIFDDVLRTAATVPGGMIAYPDGAEFLDGVVDAIFRDLA